MSCNTTVACGIAVPQKKKKKKIREMRDEVRDRRHASWKIARRIKSDQQFLSRTMPFKSDEQNVRSEANGSDILQILLRPVTTAESFANAMMKIISCVLISRRFVPVCKLARARGTIKGPIARPAGGGGGGADFSLNQTVEFSNRFALANSVTLLAARFRNARIEAIRKWRS